MATSKLRVRYIKADTIKPYQNNARTHSPEQVAQIAASLQEFGWTNPILIDSDRGVVAGHGRLLAAKQLGVVDVPVIELADLTDAQRRAYVIADNQIALNAGWDEDLLRIEIADLGAIDFDLGVLGFDDAWLDQVLTSPKPAAVPAPQLEDGNIPDVQQIAVTKPGDIWLLGAHRVLCGDSLDPAAVARLCGDARAELLHADPPYGMGKENEGVANDNLRGDNLAAFQMGWWRAWRPFLLDNASAYIWGNADELWQLWYRAGLGDSEPITLQNEIVWNKQNTPGMRSDAFTHFPVATERCMFFQLGRYKFLVGQCKDEYWQGWEPIRLALCAERDKMGLTNKRCFEIVGNHMYGHWFGSSQWSMIDRKNYQKLAAAAGGLAFTQPYDELLAQYRKLQAVFNGEIRGPAFEEFDAGRPYFDNAHEIMSDVWEFPRVLGEERFGHATPKPVAMMHRIMVSSSQPGGLVLEPFGGTGSTLMGAEVSGRTCYAMELEPQYVDVIVRRWESATGMRAELERAPIEAAA